MKLGELAEKIDAAIIAKDVAAARDLAIKGLAPTDKAGSDQVTFLTNSKFRVHLRNSQAAAVIVAEADPELTIPQLVAKHPYAAMAKAAQIFFAPRHSSHEQSDLAFVHPKAKVDKTAVLYPFSFVDEWAEIGPKVILYPHVYVGRSSKIGADSVVYANVTIMDGVSIGQRVVIHGGTTIGADGFGFAPTDTDLVKIPQVGGVTIGDDVEIGGCCTIDRGAFDNTEIANKVKIDSHVHVGHNVKVGEMSMLCGLTGIAGSAKIGKRVILAGQSGVSTGVEIADNVVLGSKAGAVSHITEPGEYAGFPAKPAGQWRREVVARQQLAELTKTVRKLAAEVKILRGET